LTDDLVAIAMKRGIARSVVPTRSLGRAAGVSHQTAARWLRGDGVGAQSEAKLRHALGLDGEQRTTRARQ
jgi:hypothetical protein